MDQPQRDPSGDRFHHPVLVTDANGHANNVVYLRSSILEVGLTAWGSVG